MSTQTFADTHNMVAFLDQPAESDGFHEIIDFMNANQIRYALTVNPTIYTSYIKQFWATTKVKTVNGERQVQALIDKKKVIITETSIRSDLYLEDAGDLRRIQSRRELRKTTAVILMRRTQQDDSVPLSISLRIHLLVVAVKDQGCFSLDEDLARNIKYLKAQLEDETYGKRKACKETEEEASMLLIE
ncbi:hypothetical protein Tco_1162570 [Tanacetum coccineum]